MLLNGECVVSLIRTVQNFQTQKENRILLFHKRLSMKTGTSSGGCQMCCHSGDKQQLQEDIRSCKFNGNSVTDCWGVGNNRGVGVSTFSV